MKRCPTDTTSALRVAGCSLCPLALPQGPRTPASGRQVARLPHDELLPERERLFHRPAVAHPLGPWLRRKTQSYPGGRQRRGGLGVGGGGGGGGGGQVRNRAPLNVGRKALSRVGGSVPGPPAALQRYSVTVARRRSGGCFRSRDIWGQTKVHWGLRPRRLTLTLSAPGWGQDSRRFCRPPPRPGRGERSPAALGSRRSAELQQSRRAASESPPRGLGSSRYPCSHLTPFASAPAPGIDQAWFPGRPPGSAQPVPCSSGRTSRGVLSRWEVLSWGREETRCLNARCNQRALLRG